jgi:hypothetical protein
MASRRSARFQGEAPDSTPTTAPVPSRASPTSAAAMIMAATPEAPSRYGSTGTAFRLALEGAHNSIHGYIGGDIGAQHQAFEDPFVFLLHANVDRLFAMWQLTG